MPREQKSLMKILVGTRTVGTFRPVIVAFGDTKNRTGPFNEYYIFQSFPGVPFPYLRTVTNPPPMTGAEAFDEFPEVFSAEALLVHAIEQAKDRLEFEIGKADRSRYIEIFCSGARLEYVEGDDSVLAQLRVEGHFPDDFETMFNSSKAEFMAELREKLRFIPEFNRRILPRDPFA